MAGETCVIAHEQLKDFAQKIFIKAGVSSRDADQMADVLVWANLRGVDSHGVQLIPWYVQAIDIGHFNLKYQIKVEKETPATLLIEADHSPGAVVTIWAMNKVIEKAKKVGIGWAAIRNTNHQAVMGYYSHMAARRDMAGIAWVCGPVNTVPYGAKAMGVSNNPIAISVPAKRHLPLTLDMATSIAAAAKLLVYRDKGLPLPPGWALDKDGNPTTDPAKGVMLLPIAGPKGSGLSLMLECLASVMVDNPKLEPVLHGREKTFGSEPIAGNPDRIRQHIQNSVIAAIDIANFTDVASYKEHIDNLIDGIKALPKVEGFTEIFVPGEPEEKTAIERAQKGIPIPEKTAASLQKVAERFGIELPPGM